MKKVIIFVILTIVIFSLTSIVFKDLKTAYSFAEFISEDIYTKAHVRILNWRPIVIAVYYDSNGDAVTAEFFNMDTIDAFYSRFEESNLD